MAETKDDRYPKWKYGPLVAAKIVNSQDEESALEGEWFDSPDFEGRMTSDTQPDGEVVIPKKPRGVPFKKRVLPAVTE